MSTNSKMIFGALGVVLLLCICAAAATVWLFQPISSALQRSLGLGGNVQSAEVDQVAREIADFQLPAGYTGQYAMSIGDFEMAVYAPSTCKSSVILMQLPPDAKADQEEMERHLWEQTHNLSYAQYTQVQTISSVPVTIRGQSGTLTISEGTNSEGQGYRLAYAIFQGKGGPAYLLIAAPLSDWNEAQVGEFVASLE